MPRQDSSCPSKQLPSFMVSLFPSGPALRKLLESHIKLELSSWVYEVWRPSLLSFSIPPPPVCNCLSVCTFLFIFPLRWEVLVNKTWQQVLFPQKLQLWHLRVSSVSKLFPLESKYTHVLSHRSSELPRKSAPLRVWLTKPSTKLSLLLRFFSDGRVAKWGWELKHLARLQLVWGITLSLSPDTCSFLAVISQCS